MNHIGVVSLFLLISLFLWWQIDPKGQNITSKRFFFLLIREICVATIALSIEQWGAGKEGGDGDLSNLNADPIYIDRGYTCHSFPENQLVLTSKRKRNPKRIKLYAKGKTFEHVHDTYIRRCLGLNCLRGYDVLWRPTANAPIQQQCEVLASSTFHMRHICGESGKAIFHPFVFPSMSSFSFNPLFSS